MVRSTLNSLIIYLLSVALLSGVSARAANLERITLKLDWKMEVQFLGFLVAKHQGFYERQGLNVDLIESNNIDEIKFIPDKVVAGDYDFAVGSQSLISAQKQGVPVVALAIIYQLSPNVIFALEDSGIRSIRDFKGHSIVIKGESWRKLLLDFLNSSGMKLSDLEEVDGGFDMMPFFDRKVDLWTGFITNEVIQARLKGYKLITFPIYEYGFTQLGSSIYSSQDFIEKNEDLVKRFLRASIEGWKWAIENPRKAVELFLEDRPDKAQQANFHYMSFNATIPLIRPPGGQILDINCQKYLKSTNISFQSPLKFCTDRFVKHLN